MTEPHSTASSTKTAKIRLAELRHVVGPDAVPVEGDEFRFPAVNDPDGVYSGEVVVRHDGYDVEILVDVYGGREYLTFTTLDVARKWFLSLTEGER
ncbi:MAG: hypothetical protein KDC23_01470 [Actinobacteria bacterium]|nr:hypothetical protein [Actinomycetota bacterium]